jgi:hypothetical protein
MKGKIWEGSCSYLKCSDGLIEGRFLFPVPSTPESLGALMGRLAEGVEVITCTDNDDEEEDDD